MKTKNILITLLAVLILGGTGCNILDKEPVSSIGPEGFFRNRKDANAYMAGIYNSLQNTLRTNYFDWGEVRSDNVQAAGTGTSQAKLVNNVLAANDSDLDAVTRWNDLYRTISLCNVAIETFPNLIANNVDAGEAVYKDQLGQAYAIRALMYFYALRVWGGTPIVNDAVTSITQEFTFPRATVQQMKAQILSDIDQSLAVIGGNTATKFYIQRAGVFALKTDVHMWFQEYPEALAASAPANFTGYNYISNPSQWKSIFTAPEGSSETIFNLFWNFVEANNRGIGVCQKIGSQSNTSQYKIRPEVVNTYYNRVNPTTQAKLDARLWLSIDTILNPTVLSYTIANSQYGKFMEINPITRGFIYQANNDCSVKIPIYRYADVMLLRAEALARTFNFSGALSILNTIRSRVGYNVPALLSDYSGSNEDIAKAIQRTILEERQLELIGEGKRWFDLCRIDDTYNFTTSGYEYLRIVMNPVLAARGGAVQFDSDLNMGRILYPINSANINANPLLKGNQNPPYSE
jgi:hypothetical protein